MKSCRERNRNSQRIADFFSPKKNPKPKLIDANVEILVLAFFVKQKLQPFKVIENWGKFCVKQCFSQWKERGNNAFYQNKKSKYFLEEKKRFWKEMSNKILIFLSGLLWPLSFLLLPGFYLTCWLNLIWACKYSQTNQNYILNLFFLVVDFIFPWRLLSSNY